ncbi:MAG: hypothetical protein ACAH65_05895 [Chloroflexota bacterium]
MTLIDRSAIQGGLERPAATVAAVAEIEPATRHSTLTEARHLVFSLQIGGWSEVEAGNLVALLLGIRPVHGGWRASEIEHLRFLKALVETGRIAH